MMTAVVVSQTQKSGRLQPDISKTEGVAHTESIDEILN